MQRAETALDGAFRAEWGRVLSALIRRVRDWDLAEEATAEAFAEAARRWPAEGVPDRPGAWLTTVAANRALDRLRRARRGAELLTQAGHEAGLTGAEPNDMDDELEALFSDPEAIEDDRLRLIFTCCHPALALEARVALTLRMLGGLSTAEIARAFLVEDATMAKRITRAKAKIAGAGIPYRVPPAELLAERTGGVLAVLYLMFNEGYLASTGDQLLRIDLCAEAVRLARVLAALMPDVPEVAGLLALMLFSGARAKARTGPEGDLVSLEDQDRTRWDRAAIGEADTLLQAALGQGAIGPYQLQAAISGVHSHAATAADTDWSEIVALYGLLTRVADTPVVRLNRAVAIAMSGDLDAGLEELETLEAGGDLGGYHLLAAARADLLRRRGDLTAAADAYRRALAQVGSEPERALLARRLAELEA